MGDSASTAAGTSVNFLGLDPGFASLGFVVVSFDPASRGQARVLRDVSGMPVMGTILTEKSAKKRTVKSSDDNVRRSRELSETLRFLLGPSPDSHPALGLRFGGVSLNIRAICAEAMSFPRNASSAQKVGIAWGIIATVSDFFDIPVVQASPQEIKKQVCGKKNASKEEIQAVLSGQFEISPDTFNKTIREHPFDALGAVVACQDSEVIRMALKMATV